MTLDELQVKFPEIFIETPLGTSYWKINICVGAEMAFRRFAVKGARDENFTWKRGRCK